MTRWKEFELLARSIYEELSPHSTVVWNDHIESRLSGTKRQIDVSVRTSWDAQEVLLVVQAKDWKLPADIKVVDQFSAVLRDVYATKGVLICRSGFTATAKQYARNLGIELYNVHDAESHNWRLDIDIPILWIDLEPRIGLGVTCYFEAGDMIS